jgi:hypothetical protein
VLLLGGAVSSGRSHNLRGRNPRNVVVLAASRLGTRNARDYGGFVLREGDAYVPCIRGSRSGSSRGGCVRRRRRCW